METTWQDLAALSAVAAAVGFLVWRLWPGAARRPGTGCGSSCGGCQSTGNRAGVDQENQLVPLESLQRKSPLGRKNGSSRHA